MTTCTDREVGAMLHAFEIGILSADDKDRFVAHLLECEYCFERVRSMQGAVALMRHDPDVRDEFEAAVSSVDSSRPVSRLWWRTMAAMPLVRFAAAAALVLAVAIPLFYSLDNNFEEGRIFQTVTLSPTRSAGTNIVRLGHGDAVKVRFVMPGANESSTAVIELFSNKGTAVYVNRDFGSFDGDGVGEIVVPLADLSAGIYQFTVRDNQGDFETAQRTYVISVKNAEVR